MNEEQELIQCFTRWDEALAANDMAGISAYMSDDWIILGSDGITTKTDFVELIASGVLQHNRMDSDKMIVKIYGDTAIIISRGTSAGLYKGQPFSLYEWSKSVFLKKNGTWLCVSTMLAPAVKKDDQ